MKEKKWESAWETLWFIEFGRGNQLPLTPKTSLTDGDVRLPSGSATGPRSRARWNCCSCDLVSPAADRRRAISEPPVTTASLVHASVHMAAPSEAPVHDDDLVIEIDPDSCELWPSSISPSEFKEFYCEPMCNFRSGSEGDLLDRDDSRRRREERSCPDILAASETFWPENNLLGQSLSFDGIPCICQEPPYSEFRERHAQYHDEDEPECSKTSCCEIDEEAEEATEEPEETSFTQRREKQFNDLFLASQRRQQKQRIHPQPRPPTPPQPPPAEHRSMCFLL